MSPELKKRLPLIAAVIVGGVILNFVAADQGTSRVALTPAAAAAAQQIELGGSAVGVTIETQMADDVVVMWRGKQVEYGPVDQIFNAPQHPYTRMLLDAISKMHDTGRARTPVSFILGMASSSMRV